MSMQGHNLPPSAVDTYTEQVARFSDRASSLPPVSDETAQRYRDEIGYGVSLAKEIDKQRDTEKRPHLEAGRKIDAAYKPLIEGAEHIQKDLKRQLSAFLSAKEAEARRVAAEKAEAARRAEEAARKAAEPEDDPFLAATADAAPDPAQAVADAKVAALEVKAAGRVASETGGFATAGLKTVRKAKVTDFVALVAHYASHTDMQTLAERLANADIRHAKGAAITIPGVEIVEERTL